MPLHAATYRAFISYSHADKACADWLHRALEGYRVPGKLVGGTTAVGKVPARLTPIFRDRDELPAAGELSGELHRALQESLFLIVIASPAAASSRWVNEEVRQFKQLHGEGRVLAVIASGEPGAGDGRECFPPALRFRLAADGTVSDQPVEPLAADLRPGGDGKRLAKLKLVAGLTGLPLDTLVQREAARRQRRLAALASVAGVLAIVMSVLAITAVRGQAEAQRQRAEADGLIEFMLTDLRTRLEPVGRLEIFDSVGQRALAYYAKQDLERLDRNALGRRARALHLVGEVSELRGDSEGALVAFREAERSTAQLLQRNPEDPQQIYDHAQSAFWVGYIAWKRGQWAEAERHFGDYDRLAASLVAIDPGNAEWQGEQSSAWTNLGVLYHRTGRFPEAIDNFRKALTASTALATSAPDPERQWTLAQAHAWLADALLGGWQFDAAMDQRRLELAVYERMLVDDPRHARAREGRAVAIGRISDLHLLKGEPAQAVEAATAAHATITGLTQDDPGNRLWHEISVASGNQLTESLLMAGRLEEAGRSNRWALERAAKLVAIDPSVQSWRTDGQMTARWLQIAISFGTDGHALARRQIAGFARDFAADLRAHEGVAATPWLMVLAMHALDRQAAGDAAAMARQLAAVRTLAPRATRPRERAVLRYLQDATKSTPLLDNQADAPPTSAQAAGYDPGTFLKPTRGT